VIRWEGSCSDRRQLRPLGPTVYEPSSLLRDCWSNSSFRNVVVENYLPSTLSRKISFVVANLNTGPTSNTQSAKRSLFFSFSYVNFWVSYSPPLRAACPAHHLHFIAPKMVGEAYKSGSSSFSCYFLFHPGIILTTVHIHPQSVFCVLCKFHTHTKQEAKLCIIRRKSEIFT
jgi:hypothetical protein